MKECQLNKMTKIPLKLPINMAQQRKGSKNFILRNQEIERTFGVIPLKIERMSPIEK